MRDGAHRPLSLRGEYDVIWPVNELANSPVPWQRLRDTGELVAEPGESVLDERAWEAAR